MGAEIGDSEVLLIGLAIDEATVTATATDPAGGTATLEIGAAVQNRGPIVCGALPRHGNVFVGETVGLPVCITDPDGHPVTDSIATGDQVSAFLSTGRDTLYLTGRSAGEAPVRLWSTDPFGLSAETRMTVRVLEGLVLFSDEFSDASGGWSETPAVYPDGFGRGKISIKDGRLNAHTPFDGWGGATKKVSAGRLVAGRSHAIPLLLYHCHGRDL